MSDVKPVKWWPTDAFGWFVFAFIAALAMAAGWAALHFGWFKSGWELAGLVALVILIGVGAGGQAARQTSVAHSRYATREDIEQVEEDATPPATTARDLGVYLGHNIMFEGDGHSARAARYKGEKHLLFFGPTRCGKSMSIIVPNLLTLRRSLIVTDPKAELAAITLRHRKTMGGKTIVLNPFGVLTEIRPDLESVGWNPLAQLDPQSPDFAGDAMCIADAIVEKTAGDGHNKFFDEYAQNLVQAVVMWERESKGRDANLCNIRPLISDDRTFEHMRKSGNRVISEMGIDLQKRLTDKDSHSTSIRDVMETLKKNLAFLNDDRIRLDMAGAGAIDFAALHRDITTIYVILPAEELRDQARWLRLFVNLTLRKLYKCAPTHDAPATLPPILLVLDEFGNLGRLGEIVKGLDMGCFSRFQLMFFLQNLGQLTRAYKDELGSFFSNIGAVSTFKTGAADMQTSEHLSKVFGDQEMRVQTQTERGASLTPQPVPLRRAEDIARLQPQVTMNIIEPCPWPMYVWTPVYAVMPRFADPPLDPNPYYHG